MSMRRLYEMIVRPKPPVRDVRALADFIDEHSAFLVQKGIYEYSRARAGHYSKVLFGEPGFQTAVEQSRWRAYPIGLAMVGEMVEGTLRPHAGPEPGATLRALSAVVLSVLDRYPMPAMETEESWQAARSELARRIQLVGLHPPKRVMDIPEPLARAYFDLMPIHKKLRGPDFPTTRNYLRVTLCNIHHELTQRMDAQAMSHTLRAGASLAPS